MELEETGGEGGDGGGHRRGCHARGAEHGAQGIGPALGRCRQIVKLHEAARPRAGLRPLDSVVIGAGRPVSRRRTSCASGKSTTSSSTPIPVPAGRGSTGGVTQHGRRPRGRRPAGVHRPDGSDRAANLVVPDYFDGYERWHHLPVVRPVQVDRVESEATSSSCARRPGLAHPDVGERDRHLDAPVRAALPGHRVVRRRTAAHGRRPGRRALPRQARARRRRRRLRGAVHRRARPSPTRCG